MELVIKGRGIQITDRIRRLTEHRLARFDRRPRPRIDRMEVELIGEATPRVGGGHSVHVACDTPRKTFRAEGAGETVEVALDQALERLQRQIATHRGKLESRQSAGRNRIQSAGTGPQEPNDPA